MIVTIVTLIIYSIICIVFVLTPVKLGIHLRESSGRAQESYDRAWGSTGPRRRRSFPAHGDQSRRAPPYDQPGRCC